MKNNEHSIDRITRIGGALVLALAVAVKAVTGVAAIIFASASAVLFLTGAIGFCGIYALLGLSTCKVPRKP